MEGYSSLLVCLSVCLSVCVCVLLLISYTTRFGATVKQHVERSCYDIPNLCGHFRKTSSLQRNGSLKLIDRSPS